MSPLNARRMAFRARQQQRHLLSDYEEKKKMVESINISTWPKKHTALYQRMQSVITSFNNEPSKTWLPSSYFQADPLNPDKELTPQMKGKIRRLLGIRPEKLKGTWHWHRPTRDMTGAILEDMEVDISYQTSLSKLEMLRRPAADALANVMRRHNFDTLASIAKLESGYNVQTTQRMKSLLGIVTQKDIYGDKQYHWLWPCDEVRDYLVELLSHGAMTKDDVCSRAMYERRYSQQLVHLVLIDEGAVICKIENKFGYEFI